MALAIQNSPEKYILEIIAGPDKGAQFQLTLGDIKIGRGDTNDVILNDARCSREHAVITISAQAIFIENKSIQNAISVDGQQGTRAFLSNGSVVTLGSTTFKFKRVLTKPNTRTTDLVSNKMNPEFNNFVQKFSSDPKKLRFYVILSIIILGAAAILSSNNNQLSKDVSLDIDNEIESSKKRQEQMLKEQLQAGKASRQYLDAQATYMKGLRDYREGLYKNAITSFGATLAIYPDHPTANKYLKLSKEKLDTQIQMILREGNSFMEQNKYQLAKSAFKNIFVLVNDPDDKRYQEAKEKFNECTLLLRESF